MKTSSFDLRELVPPEVYTERGDAAWELLDPRALQTLDAIRGAVGPITVNNWHTGGPYKESGLRTPHCATYKPYSQHTFGRAFDMKSARLTPQELHAYIIAHPDLFPLITTLENITATPTWVHFDVRNNPSPGIRIVNP